MNEKTHAAAKPSFFVRFANLFDAGRAFEFPCDERGGVNLNALSDRARWNYLFARAMVGREFLPPRILAPLTDGAAPPLAS